MHTDTAWINYGVGMVYLMKGESQKAEAIFNEILDGNPAYGFVLARLGFMRHSEGNIEEGRMLFHEVLDNLPHDEMGLYYRGHVLTILGNYDKAAESFSRVIKQNPHRFDAIVFLASLFGRKGDYGKAEDLIDEVYRENENFRNGFAWLGWIITETQDWSGALRIMNRDYNEGRMDPEMLVHMAQVLGRVGNWDEAAKVIKKAYASANYLKDGFARLAWIKAESQDWTGALDMIKRDVDADRISPEWRIKFAMLHVFTDDQGGAVKLIHDLYSNNKKIMDGYANLGWAHYLLSNDIQNLKTLVRKDNGLNRLSIHGKKINAIAMSIDGQVNEAAALLASLYSDNPLVKDGFAMIGWEMIESGDRGGGMAFIEKDFISNRLSSIWRINYSYQLTKEGQYRKAQDLFHKVMELEPYRKEVRIGDQIMPSLVISLNAFRKMIGLESSGE